ncbi:MAG TPA: hypothetical protein VJG90_02375 [Candidatus Nanoarchaeia archaeon]|nr:hypothetical protein [Candidatus Nanoarchaeia archaeon]
MSDDFMTYPYGGFDAHAEVMAVELAFLRCARVEVPVPVLQARVLSLVGVFTQHLSSLKKARVLDDVVESMVVIGEAHRRPDDFSDPFWYVENVSLGFQLGM